MQLRQQATVSANISMQILWCSATPFLPVQCVYCFWRQECTGCPLLWELADLMDSCQSEKQLYFHLTGPSTLEHALLLYG